MRLFLANYLFNPDKPIPINRINILGMGDSIAKTYQRVCKEKFESDNPEQVVRLRKTVLKTLTNNGAELNFVKSHNDNRIIFDYPLIPKEVTRSAIYIVRNPLDTLVSFSNHMGQSIDEGIESFRRSSNILRADSMNTMQFLGSWSSHVRSWVDEKGFPVIAIRYEDMLLEPENAFAKVLEFIGVPIDKERLEKAIRFSSFKELSGQEASHGFIENSKKQGKFFRKGEVGQWKTVLSEKQAQTVYGHHKKIMRRFGYELEG